jgi:hypothetical protein
MHSHPLGIEVLSLAWGKEQEGCARPSSVHLSCKAIQAPLLDGHASLDPGPATSFACSVSLSALSGGLALPSQAGLRSANFIAACCSLFSLSLVREAPTVARVVRIEEQVLLPRPAILLVQRAGPSPALAKPKVLNAVARNGCHLTMLAVQFDCLPLQRIIVEAAQRWVLQF